MGNKIIQSIKTGVANSRLLKFFRNKFVVVTILFLVWILFLDTNNVFVWLNDMNEVNNQERQIEYYKDAIKHTDEKLKELSSNKDSLEKFAREQYLFHEKDEEVFIIVE